MAIKTKAAKCELAKVAAKMSVISDQCNQWIYLVLRQIHLNSCESLLDRGNQLGSSVKDSHSSHMYMMTVKYQQSSVFGQSSLDNHLSKINSNFEGLYNVIRKDIISGNVFRQKHLHPICWMFVDGANTRAGGYFNTSRLGESTHHHGVMLLHPLLNESFKKLDIDLHCHYWAASTPNVASLKIQPVSDAAGALTVIDYSQKVVKQMRSRSQIGVDLDFILPHFKDGELAKLTQGLPSIDQLAA